MIGAALLLGACASPPDLEPLERTVLAREVRLAPDLAGSRFGGAVARAVATSPAFGRSQAALLEREADLLAAGGWAVPQLSLGLRPGGGTGFETSALATLTQLVFDAGAGAARERAAEARVLGGVAGRIEAGSQATFQAVATWSDVASARALRGAAETSLRSLERTTARIEERAEAGAGTSSDLLTAQSRLANERAMVVDARTRVIEAEAAFVEVFGMPAPTGIGQPPQAPVLPEGGVAGSPVLLQAEAGRLAAEAELAAAKAGLVPALSVRVTSTGLTGAADVSAGPVTEDVAVPGRARSAQIAAAEARLEARRVDLDAAQRELQSRLNRLAATAAAARDRLAAAEVAAEANSTNLAAAQDQFLIGRRSLIELLDAEREALASERLRIVAQQDRALAGYALLAVTGDILDLFALSPETLTSVRLTGRES